MNKHGNKSALLNSAWKQSEQSDEGGRAAPHFVDLGRPIFKMVEQMKPHEIQTRIDLLEAQIHAMRRTKKRGQIAQKKKEVRELKSKIGAT